MRKHLQLEELESRTLLSSAPLASPVAGAGSHLPDTGMRYDLTGTGKLDLTGPVKVSGYVQTTGFVASGHASGSITFTNALGSLTLGLTGPTQPGFAPLPVHFTFTVTGGTGAYQHETITGSIDFHFTFGAHGAYTYTFTMHTSA
jgi:hypothetical protein